MSKVKKRKSLKLTKHEKVNLFYVQNFELMYFYFVQDGYKSVNQYTFLRNKIKTKSCNNADKHINKRFQAIKFCRMF